MHRGDPGRRLPTRAPVVQRRRSTRSAAHIKINACATHRLFHSPQLAITLTKSPSRLSVTLGGDVTDGAAQRTFGNVETPDPGAMGAGVVLNRKCKKSRKSVGFPLSRGGAASHNLIAR